MKETVQFEKVRKLATMDKIKQIPESEIDIYKDLQDQYQKLDKENNNEGNK